MSGPLPQYQHHVVTIQLKGPQTKEQIQQFHRALRALAQRSGGTMRIQPRKKGRPRARAAKRSRRRA